MARVKNGSPGVYKARIAELPESVCSCEACVQMCRRRPCWGTPEDIQRLIDAGFARSLMRDWWEGGVNTEASSIDVIAPAIVGYEGHSAPSWPDGACTFLTPDGLCSLHDRGLKPTEGRVAHHTTLADGPHPDLHRMVAALWESDEGRAVAANWHRALEESREARHED